MFVWALPILSGGAAGVAGEAYLQRSQKSKGLLSLRRRSPGCLLWLTPHHLLAVFFCWLKRGKILGDILRVGVGMFSISLNFGESPEK